MSQDTQRYEHEEQVEKKLVFSSDEEEEEGEYTVSKIQWDEYILPFGKHKGKKLDELLLRKNTRGYMRWLTKQDWVYDSHKEHVETALKLYRKKKRKATKAKSRSKQEKI